MRGLLSSGNNPFNNKGASRQKIAEKTMSGWYQEIPVGTALTTRKAVKSAIVAEEGIDCVFVNGLTGEETKKRMLITVDEYCDWVNGSLIQDAMPGLSADDRELFLTGMVF